MMSGQKVKVRWSEVMKKLGDREASLRHIVNETMRLIRRIVIPLRLRVHRLLKGV
jgi:hypothetical protein